MIITPMVHSDALPTYLDDVKKEIEQYFNKNKDGIVSDGNMVKSRTETKGKTCSLEFFYYFSNGGSWKNAIWIRVNGNSGLWLYIHRNVNNANKVCIFSRKDLKISGFPQKKVAAFGLPNDDTPPSAFVGGPIFIEKIIVSRGIDIIKEMNRRLPIVCV